MPGLPLSLIPIPLTGLQTKADPKSAPIGLTALMENCWARRRTNGGGVELIKRYGYTSLTRSIQGGGTIAEGRRLGVLNDELALADGLKLYSYSAALGKWLPRGKFQHIAADVRTISGFEAGAQQVNVDSAYSGNYACHVGSPDASTSPSTIARIYIEDTTTGEVIASALHASGVYRARVLALSGAFYIFSWNGSGKIRCQKIDAATPTTFGTITDVATNANTSGVFDCCVDAANARMVVGYRNSTPTLTLGIWTTGMAAGTTAAYASIDPAGCIGFLNHDFADGSGYVAVGTTGAPETRALTFSASTMVVATNTLLATPAVFTRWITGYKAPTGVASGINVLWTEDPVAAGGPKIRAYGDGTLYDAMLSVGVGSRPFKVGTKWYIIAAYQTEVLGPGLTIRTGQRRTLLLELGEENGAGAAGLVNVAGLLLGDDSAGAPASRSCIPTATVVSASRVRFSTGGVASVSAAAETASQQHSTLLNLDLDWTGATLGRPVVYGGVLHLPAAASKIWDGRSVVENGFYVNPEVPDATAAGGGSLTLLGTYDYCFVWARTDTAGRLWRSAPGPLGTFTLSGTDNKFTISGRSLGVTDSDPRYNLNGGVTKSRIEIYRSEAGLPNMYLCGVVENDATTATFSFVDTMSDDALVLNEGLYTSGDVLDHFAPPAVKVLHRHGSRLFAITGDGSVWHTKKQEEGQGAEWTDAFRFTIEQGEGVPLAMGTVDSTCAIFKRNRTFLLQGDGPDIQGNNEYPAPQALNDDAGAVSAGAVLELGDGVLAKSPKGWQVLGRDLALQPVESFAGFDALSPAFGTLVDGRPLAVIPTTGGEALVYDWQLKQFYDWTGPATYLAGVCSARWRNTLVILKADGTVRQEVVGQYNDDGAAIADAVKCAWIGLGNARVYRVLVTGEYPATTTVSTTYAENLDDATASTRSHAVTAATKNPLVHPPISGDASEVQLQIGESSTTEGVRLTKIELEVGLRQGAPKRRASAYGT